MSEKGICEGVDFIDKNAQYFGLKIEFCPEFKQRG
jgi:hypothetical protein